MITRGKLSCLSSTIINMGTRNQFTSIFFTTFSQYNQSDPIPPKFSLIYQLYYPTYICCHIHTYMALNCMNFPLLYQNFLSHKPVNKGWLPPCQWRSSWSWSWSWIHWQQRTLNKPDAQKWGADYTFTANGGLWQWILSGFNIRVLADKETGATGSPSVCRKHKCYK